MDQIAFADKASLRPRRGEAFHSHPIGFQRLGVRIKDEAIAATGGAQMLLILAARNRERAKVAFEKCSNATMAAKDQGAIGFGKGDGGPNGRNNSRLRIDRPLPPGNTLIWVCEELVGVLLKEWPGQKPRGGAIILIHAGMGNDLRAQGRTDDVSQLDGFAFRARKYLYRARQQIALRKVLRAVPTDR